ncbi:MAG TPA: STAS domain-containing protein [Pengzhenrongella sp.]
MTITEGRGADGYHVAMVGRLDVRSVPDLRLTLHRVIDGGAESILLDLSDAEIGDSTGLGMLVECLQRARRAGAVLRVAVRDGRSARLMRRARLGSVLVPAPTAGPAGVAAEPAVQAG